MKKTKMAAAVATAQADAPIDWTKYSGQTTGFENVNREDLGIPFLSIVQKGSPEFDSSSKDYATKRIEGCKPGDVFNTLSRQIMYSHGGTALQFVPCGYDKQYVEWKTRESGGGFVKAHRDPKILEEIVSRNEKGQDVLRSGNIIATTAYFFGLVLAEKTEPAQVVIGMTSTQLKHARFWLNLMAGLRIGPQRITPPMFSHNYLLATVAENNAKGSWMGWKIVVGAMINDAKLVADAANICAKVTNPTNPLLGTGARPLAGAPAEAEDNVSM